MDVGGWVLYRQASGSDIVAEVKLGWLKERRKAG